MIKPPQKLSLPYAAGLNPSVRSDSGFKAPSEDMAEIIEADRQTLDELGITHEQIIGAMKQTRAIVANPLARTIDGGTLLLQKIGLCKDRQPSTEVLKLVQQHPDLAHGQMVYSRLDKFIVGSRPYLGTQLCPFHCKTSTAVDFFVLNQETNHSMLYSGLMPHLIGEHSFFEGHVIYRVDPIHAALVFGIPTQHTVAKLDQLWQEKLARLSESSDPAIRDFAAYHQNGNYLEQANRLLRIGSTTSSLTADDKRALLLLKRKHKRKSRKPTST